MWAQVSSVSFWGALWHCALSYHGPSPHFCCCCCRHHQQHPVDQDRVFGYTHSTMTMLILCCDAAKGSNLNGNIVVQRTHTHSALIFFPFHLVANDNIFSRMNFSVVGSFFSVHNDKIILYRHAFMHNTKPVASMEFEAKEETSTTRRAHTRRRRIHTKWIQGHQLIFHFNALPTYSNTGSYSLFCIHVQPFLLRDEKNDWQKRTSHGYTHIHTQRQNHTKETSLYGHIRVT